MAAIAAFGGGRFEGRAGLAIALVAGVAVAVQAGHLATPVFVAVAGLAPEALALTPFLAAFALYPLLSGASGGFGRAACAGAAVLGVVVLAVVALRDPATARTPRPVQAFYLDDAAAGQTWRASTLDRLDAWSKGALGPEKAIRRGDLTPILGKPWLAPTPSAALERPVFSETSTPTPSGRAVTVTIAPHDGGRELRLFLQPIPIHHRCAAGRAKHGVGAGARPLVAASLGSAHRGHNADLPSQGIGFARPPLRGDHRRLARRRLGPAEGGRRHAMGSVGQDGAAGSVRGEVVIKPGATAHARAARPGRSAPPASGAAKR